MQPQNITEAARLAAKISNTAPQKHLAHSTIPLIIHQTWKSTDIESFPETALPGMESWLQYADHPDLPNMAYFMWTDDGIVDLMSQTDPILLSYFNMLPRIVEKADVFRVAVCNIIGGVVRHQNKKLATLRKTLGASTLLTECVNSMPM